LLKEFTMLQPEALKKNERLLWTTGTGVDVWELFCSCIRGDLEAVQRLCARDPSLVRTQYAYRTPLYFAVRENQRAIAAYLLDQGADPFGLAVHDSLLQIARDRGYAEMESLLQAKYLSLHGASPKGEVLAAAIRQRDTAKVTSLLDATPDLLHAGDERGNLPIHWATMTRQLDILDLLLTRGADINARRPDGARPIQLTNGDYHFRGYRDVGRDWPTTPGQVREHLTKHGADVDICSAAYWGDQGRVKALLAEDSSLANRVGDYLGYYACSGSPLRNAALGGHIDIVRLLLEHGADPNLREEGIAPQGHALYAAVAAGRHEIARLLLAAGAYPNPAVESSADALSRAITNSDKQMIDLLCSHGAARTVDLLAYDGDVRTAAAVFAANPALADDPDALANAAGEGHQSFIRLQLRYKPDLPKRLVFPPWSVGAKTRELDELLFQHGMNPSQPDWLGITPLHQFARKGDRERATLFLDHGAELHARDDEFCSTPLGWAAKYGQASMAELLVQRGAKLNLPDDPPWATPLAWASRRGHRELAEQLARCGAH
jgi:ankyrin repeat protein